MRRHHRPTTVFPDFNCLFATRRQPYTHLVLKIGNELDRKDVYSRAVTEVIINSGSNGKSHTSILNTPRTRLTVGLLNDVSDCLQTQFKDLASINTRQIFNMLVTS